MSTETETEQITNVPNDLEKRPVRMKDPKSVAAGKALAKKNKEAREAFIGQRGEVQPWK